MMKLPVVFLYIGYVLLTLAAYSFDWQYPSGAFDQMSLTTQSETFNDEVY